MLKIILLLGLVASATKASDSFERTTSVSHAYDSRSVFTNPAALGFQTELNGAELSAAFAYDLQKNLGDQFAGSLAYGYLGLGVEHLSDILGYFNRYSLGIGVPVNPYWYLGGRYSFTRSTESHLLDGVNSLDFGLQFRPRPEFSFGLLAANVNVPTVNGLYHPAQFIAGVTVRPLPHLELSLDGSTATDNFFRQFGYRGNVGYEIFSGLKVRVGYDSVQQIQAGLQFNFDRGSVYAIAQPSSHHQSLVTGLQFSSTPYASDLRPKGVLKIEVDSSLKEEGTSGNLFTKGRPSLMGMVKALEKAESDPAIGTIAIHIESFPLGLAAAEEMHKALWKCREAGKNVEVYLSNAGLKEYLIAAAAQQIHMEPNGELRFLGLRAQSYYLKGTLDKIGVEGQFLARGKYKSAPEMFTRTDASPVHHEQALHQLDLAEKTLLDLLYKSRHITTNDWNQLLATALVDASQAKQMKLIDAIDFFSDAEAHWEGPVRESLTTKLDLLALPPRIAVVVAEGDILNKKIPALSLAGESQITPQRMKNRFKAALSDPRTRAIVVRVSSGGGEVVASDEIAKLVEEAKEKGKTVIVSMGDVAASGGYMIAAAGQKIFADDLTITGSIGVFLGNFNFGNLYKKIELHKEILSRAPFAGLLTEDRAWTAPERAILERRLNQYYDSFVGSVAKHRHLNLSEAEESAQGRVWLGSEAISRKLVDQKGGLLDAIHDAAGQLGFSPGQYQSWLVEDPKGLFEFFDPDSVFASADPIGSITLGILGSETFEQIKWLAQFRQSPFLYWSPVRRLE